MPWAVTKGIVSYTDRQPDKQKPTIIYNPTTQLLTMKSGGPCLICVAKWLV